MDLSSITLLTNTLFVYFVLLLNLHVAVLSRAPSVTSTSTIMAYDIGSFDACIVFEFQVALGPGLGMSVADFSNT